MLNSLFDSSQTLLFASIACASFLLVAGSFLFGGGHDDVGDHGGHDVGHLHDGDASISFFSPRVIFTFTLGFGASGAIASVYGLKTHWSVLIGLGSGLVLATAAYYFMTLFYSQQSTSLIDTNNTLGKTAQVLTAIPPNGSGEVGLEVQGQYQVYLARCRGADAIPKGSRVRVLENAAGQLIVELVR